MADPRSPDSRSLNTPRAPGAPAGDFGEADDELLVDGQEEVFSRSEVESGRIEHQAEAGSDAHAMAGPSTNRRSGSRPAER